MSQSLQSWLLSTLNADAASALDMRTELADMPYLTGNRVQIIKFLTFRPAEDPNKLMDVWALVGDRTHMIPARFVAGQVSRYQKLHPSVVFTTLRGAVVMVRQFRCTVSRVPAMVAGVPWRDGEWVPALEVCGFEVLGSIGEATFWPRAKFIAREDGSDLVKWLGKWTRKKQERETKRKRLAEDQPPPPSVNAETDNSVDLALSGAQAFPTPAQRAPPTKQLPRDPASQTPVKSADPTPVSVKALETKSVTPEIKPVDAKAKSPWDDFDLDEDLPPSNLLPTLSYSLQDFLKPDDPPAPLEGVQPVKRASIGPGPNEDPDESGLSDHDRKDRQEKGRVAAKRRKVDAQEKLKALMASIID